MIKINLLPQKRAKRGASRAAASPAAASQDAGTKQFALGLGALAAAAVVVFFGLDRPRTSRIHDLNQAKIEINQQIAEKRKQLVGYEEMKKAKADTEARAAAIARLMGAKVVPAHVLQELGEIFTQNHLPAMTEEMRKLVGNGPGSDPTKRFKLDWDPTTVWLFAYTDRGGNFTIEGGARDEQDVTQLSKRLAASVHFYDITPVGGERVADRERNINYYRFTITGKVAY